MPFHRKWYVFGLTWLSYAAYYLTRKNFSIVKSRLHEELGVSISWLAAADTAYLSLYALGQFINGPLGDRFGAKRLLVFGMFGCALLSMVFGFATSALAFAHLFGLQGFFQSTGWSNNVKAITPWFGDGVRGRIMGFWSTNYQVGGLVASALAAFLLAHYGWRSAFFAPAVAVFLVGLALLFFLPSPEAESDHVRQKNKLNAPSVWRNPHVWVLGLAYFCLKLIRYSLLFWLPFYLHRQLGLGEESSGYLSIVIEVGGIVGAIITGMLADKFLATKRSYLVAPLFFGLSISLLVYQMIGVDNIFFNAIAMSVVGFFIYGPDTLISGACSQDLGGENRTASVAGAINGIGSIGAIMQGVVTAYVSETWGWQALFTAFTLLALVAGVLVALSQSFIARDAAKWRQFDNPLTSDK